MKKALMFLMIMGFATMILNPKYDFMISSQDLEQSSNKIMSIFAIPQKSINYILELEDKLETKRYEENGIIYEQNWFQRLFGMKGYAVGTTSHGGGGGGFHGR
jgi:hypothetical protein